MTGFFSISRLTHSMAAVWGEVLEMHLFPSLQTTLWPLWRLGPACLTGLLLWVKLHCKTAGLKMQSLPPCLKCHLMMLDASSRIPLFQHRPGHCYSSLWLLIAPLFRENWGAEASVTNADPSVCRSWCWENFSSNCMVNVSFPLHFALSLFYFSWRMTANTT